MKEIVLGSPLSPSATKVMLLGSGELGGIEEKGIAFAGVDEALRVVQTPPHGRRAGERPRHRRGEGAREAGGKQGGSGETLMT